MSIPAAIVVVILIWSTTPVAIKWSGEGPGFLFGVCARMLLSAVLCLLIVSLLRISLPWNRAARYAYIAAGVGIYGAMLSVYWAAQTIPSGLISVIFGLTPIVTGGLAALWLKERIFSVARIAGLMLGLLGLLLVFRSQLSLNSEAWQAMVIMFLSVFIHSASTVGVKRVGAAIPALALTTGALLVAVPLYLLTWWIFDGALPSHIPVRAGLSILYLGVVGSVIGFVLYYYMLKRMEAARLALITLVTPVSALILGQVLNGEQIPAMVWIGTLIICVALVCFQWPDWSEARRAKTSRQA